MATVESRTPAPPQAVFDVLSTPESYPRWVVGGRAVHIADPDFPRPGSLFEHSQGLGPLSQRDTTRVLESEPPRRLVLEARLRPWIVSRIEFTLHEEDSGTRIAMAQQVTGGALWLARNPLLDVAMRVRDRETLRRLGRVAEQHARAVRAAGS